MEQIRLEGIEKNGCTLRYDFTYTPGLARFFSGKPFELVYPQSIEPVPDGVLAIPFVANVLPLTWLQDAELILPELDQDFYDCIPVLKRSYAQMYPEARWQGSIQVERLLDCSREGAQGAAAMFSGGVDATMTLLRHYEERPQLITIWGSDIAWDNREGWRTMEKGLADTAQAYGLPLQVIRSGFRQFDEEEVLAQEYQALLQEHWWFGVKHGIAIICHAAPLMWLEKLRTLYMASSFCAADQQVRCASYPTIDDNVRFFGCQVFHDGFELSRQDKIRGIIRRKEELGLPVFLHVCWESKGGGNCCGCEKCLRTMVGFWAEGVDPADYGFCFDPETIFDRMYDLLAMRYLYSAGTISDWLPIQETMRQNWQALRQKPWGKKLQWILDFDFVHFEENPCRKEARRKQSRAWETERRKEAIIKAFPQLHKIYSWFVRRLRPAMARERQWRQYAWPYVKVKWLHPKTLFLVMTPEHENVGDHAIALSETRFLEAMGLPFREVTSHQIAVLESKGLLGIFNGSTIVANGGGYLGTLWFSSEQMLRELIRSNPKSKIVLLPNTIYYEASAWGQEEKRKSVEIYNRHEDLTLFAREQNSYEQMKALYKNVHLVPDMVLTMEFGQSPWARKGCAVCLRNDCEKTMPEDQQMLLEQTVRKYFGNQVKQTDMVQTHWVPVSRRQQTVEEKIQEFQKVQLVITDRLHGMVLCAISNTPCIVFGSKSHKVRGTYDWIRHLPYIRFADSAEQLDALIPELLAQKACRYDNSGLLPYYEKVREVLRKDV